MKFAGIRSGAKVQDKITKEILSVSVSDGHVMLLDDDGNALREMTEATAETYRYLGNDTPAPKPNASVNDDGEFVVDGVTIVTGQLKPVKVFPVRGKVLVMTEPLGDNATEGAVDVYEYEPIFDKFTKLLGSVMNPLITEVADGLYVIAYNNTYEYTIKAKNKDEQDKVITAVSEASVLIYNGKNVTVVYTGVKPVPATAEDFHVIDRAEAMILTFASTQSAKYLDTCDDCDDEDCDDCDCEDCDGSVAELVDLDRKTRVVVLSSSKDEDGNLSSYWTSNEWIVNGEFKSVTDAMDSSYLIVTDKEVVFTNNGHRKRIASGAAAVKAGESHPYLVGAIVKLDTFTLTLSDENRNVVRIVSRDTRDRGTLVTVEQ